MHGFRDLGTLFSKPKPYPLRKEDNPFCPCPPHPWRSFQLSGGPNIWERRHAAEKAWEELPGDPTSESDFQEEHRRLAEVIDKDEAARQEWIRNSGQKLPSSQELVKLEWIRARTLSYLHPWVTV